MAAPVWLAGRVGPELWYPHIHGIVSGERGAAAPDIAILVDVATAAGSGGKAWLVLVPCVVPIPPSTLTRLPWSLFRSPVPLANSILGSALVALLRLLLFTLDAVTEGIFGSALVALHRLLLFTLDAFTEGILGSALFALIRHLFLALNPLSKALSSKASIPLFRSFARSLESFAQGAGRHPWGYRTATGETVSSQVSIHISGATCWSGVSCCQRATANGSRRDRRITFLESRRFRRIILTGSRRTGRRITPRHRAGAGSRRTGRRINQGVFLGSPTTTVLTTG